MKTRALLLLILCSACRVTCGQVRMPPTPQQSAREPAIDVDRQREQAQREIAASQRAGAGHVNIPNAAIAGVAGGALIGVGVAATLSGDGGAPPSSPSDSR